jgi:outer membrane protein TolC
LHHGGYPDQNGFLMKVHPLATCTLFLAAALSCAVGAQDSVSSAKNKSSDKSAEKTAEKPAEKPSETRGSVVSSEFGTTARVRQLTGKLNLVDAVNLALRQNPDVLRALREIERAHGRVIEVRAQALPHIALNSNYNEIDPHLFRVNPLAGSQMMATQNKSWNIALEVRQVLYSGGRISGNIAAERLTQDGLYFSLRDTLDKTVSQVRQQFSTVLATRGLIGVAEESVELASQQLRDANNRFEAGTVPRFNVLRAEVELASVKPALIRAKNDYLIARLQLARTLGIDPAADGKPSFECVGELQISYRTMSLGDAISLGRARRPSLKAQRQQILVEKERLKVARAGFKPQLSVSTGYRKVNSAVSLSIDDAVAGYFVGINGTWNIFDSFETVGQVTQAKARIDSAIVTYEDALLNVELEVQKAYADLQQYRETVESQQKNVEQAREALRLSQERLGAGAGTQLEVLDARVALTRARTIELQARADYVRSLAEFDRATATDTVYVELFKDPLAALEKKVLHKGKPPSAADLFKP